MACLTTLFKIVFFFCFLVKRKSIKLLTNNSTYKILQKQKTKKQKTKTKTKKKQNTPNNFHPYVASQQKGKKKHYQTNQSSD